MMRMSMPMTASAQNGYTKITNTVRISADRRPHDTEHQPARVPGEDESADADLHDPERRARTNPTS